MAIGAGKRLVRNNIGMRITVTLGRKSTDQGIERLVRQCRHLHIKQRYIDMAPFPRALTLMQGRQHPNRGVKGSEEHTSELQSRPHLVCRLLLEKKNIGQSLEPSP